MSQKKGLSLKELFARPDNGKAPLKERLSEEEYKRRERISNIVIFSGIGVSIIIGLILAYFMVPRY
jgi:hypothetical protein